MLMVFGSGSCLPAASWQGMCRTACQEPGLDLLLLCPQPGQGTDTGLSLGCLLLQGRLLESCDRAAAHPLWCMKIFVGLAQQSTVRGRHPESLKNWHISHRWLKREPKVDLQL